MASICMFGGSKEWLEWTAEVLRGAGHQVVVALEVKVAEMKDADLIVVGTSREDVWDHVPQGLRHGTVVFHPGSLHGVAGLQTVRVIFKAGFHDCLSKPYAKEELEKVIAQFFAEV